MHRAPPIVVCVQLCYGHLVLHPLDLALRLTLRLALRPHDLRPRDLHPRDLLLLQKKCEDRRS